MLYPSFFDTPTADFRKRVLCVVCSVYYTRFTNREKVYVKVTKPENSLDVPSNLISPKTVSSLFVFKNINNYLKKSETKNRIFEGCCSFFLENGKNTLHTTHYTLHTIFQRGVKCEV